MMAMQSGGMTVVAVVGLAHVKGMVEIFEKGIDHDDLAVISALPPPSWLIAEDDLEDKERKIVMERQRK